MYFSPWCGVHSGYSLSFKIYYSILRKEYFDWPLNFCSISHYGKCLRYDQQQKHQWQQIYLKQRPITAMTQQPDVPHIICYDTNHQEFSTVKVGLQGLFFFLSTPYKCRVRSTSHGTAHSPSAWERIPTRIWDGHAWHYRASGQTPSLTLLAMRTSLCL